MYINKFLDYYYYEGDFDSAFFAKHFMKNREETTNIHYNLLSNRRHAINIAMKLYSSFSGVQVKDIDGMTNAMKPCNDIEKILNWVNEADEEMTKGETTEMKQMLRGLSKQQSSSDFYGKSASFQVRHYYYFNIKGPIDQVF